MAGHGVEEDSSFQALTDQCKGVGWAAERSRQGIRQDM